MSKDPRLSFYNNRKNPLLICVPPAGIGISIFASWKIGLSEYTDLALLQLPGREDLFGSSLTKSLPELAANTAKEIANTQYSKIVFFGHSMGSTIAWWIASELYRNHNLSASVIVSGQAPDSIICNSDEKFVSVERWYERLSEPLPKILLKPDVREIFSQTLAHDIRWMQSEFIRELPGPYPIPLTGIAALQDKLVPSCSMALWHKVSTCEFKLHMVSGGHQLLSDNPDAVKNILVSQFEKESFDDT
jgi:surfactin synthase thioesterase subunit